MLRPLVSAVITAGVIFAAVACGSSSGEPGSTGGSGSTANGGATFGAGGAPAGGSSTNAGGALPVGTGASISVGTGGTTAVCKKTGDSCADSAECCTGNICNNTAGSAELNGCHPPCTQNADCSTGCCVLFSGATRGICGDAKWCACGTAGSKCGSQLPACCSDQTCLSGDAAQSFYECKKRCTQNADCPTSCCVPIPGLNLSACLDKSYCP
jgi:hypothetical protein